MNILRPARRGPVPSTKVCPAPALAAPVATGGAGVVPPVPTNLVNSTAAAMIPSDSVVDGVTGTDRGNVDMYGSPTSTTAEVGLAAQPDLVGWPRRSSATSAASTRPATRRRRRPLLGPPVTSAANQGRARQ